MADSNINFRVQVSSQQADLAFQKLQKEIGDVSGTAAALEYKIRQLTTLLKQSLPGTPAFAMFQKELAKTEGELAQVQQAMLQTAKTSDIMAQRMRTARIANVGFVRVVQDAPFFMSSFNMGVMAVSNNIPMLVDGLVAARKATSGWGQALKLTLAGTSPWLTAINLLVSGILAYSLVSRNSTKDNKDFGSSLKDLTGETNTFAESLNKVAKEIRALPISEIEGTISKLREQLSEFTDEFAATISKLALTTGLAGMPGAVGAAGSFFSAIMGTEEEFNQATERFTKFINAINEANKQLQGPVGRVGRLKEQIKLLREQLDSASDAEIPKIVNQITKFEKELRDLTTITKKQSDEVGILTKLWGDYVDVINKFQIPREIKNFMTGTPRQLEGVAVPRRDQRESVTMQELKESFRVQFVLAQTTAEAVGQVFMNMWEDVFGRANSLAEQFLQNFVARLASLATDYLQQQIFLAFVGTTTGAPTGGVGLMSPFGNIQTTGGTTAPKEVSITYINLGDRNIAQVVHEGNITSRRLRYAT